MKALEPNIQGVAALLLRENINTDIITAQTELVTVSKNHLGKGIFARWRYLADGNENPMFPLNQEKYRSAKILITGENFGCGSSREHAVWGILDYGIQCIIAPSFAPIFRENAYKNKLLLIELSQQELASLIQKIEVSVEKVFMSIDLINQRILVNELTIGFHLPPSIKEYLLQSTDEIDLTLMHQDAIAAFQKHDWKKRPWIYQTSQ